MSNFTKPPSIRTFLNHGGNAKTVLGEPRFTFLLEEHRAALTLPASQREQRAFNLRYSVSANLKGDPVVGTSAEESDTWLMETPARSQTALTKDAWAADLYEDPALGERILECLDPAERIERELLVEFTRSPHPTEVGVPDGHWACDDCGTAFENGVAPAFQPGSRPGYSDSEDLIIKYCTSCLETALTRMRGFDR
jgi:hypothetical protein